MKAPRILWVGEFPEQSVLDSMYHSHDLQELVQDQYTCKSSHGFSTKDRVFVNLHAADHLDRVLKTYPGSWCLRMSRHRPLFFALQSSPSSSIPSRPIVGAKHPDFSHLTKNIWTSKCSHLLVEHRYTPAFLLSPLLSSVHVPVDTLDPQIPHGSVVSALSDLVMNVCTSTSRDTLVPTKVGMNCSSDQISHNSNRPFTR